MVAIAVVLTSVAPAGAAPVPNPLPWQRQYVSEAWRDPQEALLALYPMCARDRERGVWDNGAIGRTKIAVLGDSVQAQTRDATMADTEHYRWLDLTHCGENFGTVIDSGRLDDVIARQPEILISGFGTNNFTEMWFVVPALFPKFSANLDRYLDRTDHIPCRVFLNFSMRPATYHPANEQAMWQDLLTSANLRFAQIDTTDHPGVIIADWAKLTEEHPEYLLDDQHLTGAGINARINLALAASRKCLPPDQPVNIGAVASSGSATVWWDPLPPEEGDITYTVTSSTGHTVTTKANNVNVSGLGNGIPVSFRVKATNSKGTSNVGPWSNSVTPSPQGARFRPLAPTRVLDTRSGLGGRSGPVLGGQTITVNPTGLLPAGAGDASALVLNVTATGQTADSFVTVWPGGQTRPLASSLNPKPGIHAVAASVTARTGPGGTIQLYNSAGSTHLVADVVGWYEPPSDRTANVFHPVAPTRLLDTRDGTGAPAGPIGSGTTRTVTPLDVPDGAVAAVVNVTSTAASLPSFVTLFPSGSPRPEASALNPQPGVTRANLATVMLGPDGTFQVYNQWGTTEVVVDLVGWYGADALAPGGADYVAITPERRLDTRDGSGGVTGPVGNAAPLSVALAGAGTVPASAKVVAVDANITVVAPKAEGHTTVWPAGLPQPKASVLNYRYGEVVANRDIVPLGSGAALLWSVAPSIQYVVDVSGWFTTP